MSTTDANHKIPAHVAIVMDGNGRWAKQRHQPRLFGHKAGVRALHNTVDAADKLGIKYLTVYAFSTENWKRSEEEVGGLMKLAMEALINEIDELNANNVVVNFIGDLAQVPPHLQAAADEAHNKTAANTGLSLNIAFNYGGRDEILKAAQALIRKGADADSLTEADFAAELFTSDWPDPDIMIRTGGEKRLSNFLLWQNAYAEFFFPDVLWPDFGYSELAAIVEEFGKRERRFGTA